MNPRALWDDDRPLLAMRGDAWRIRDACEGVAIFGGTGSGKTSGSGRALAEAYLRAGFGGLVLCAKTDEARLWEAHAAAAGRTEDLILFGGEGGWSFNFLEHEALRAGEGAGLTENTVNLFVDIASVGAGSGGTGGGDPFWERAMRSLVRNCADLLALAGEPVTLPGMFGALRSAADDPATVASPDWRRHSACWALLERARAGRVGTRAEADFREVEAYWTRDLPGLGDRTRGSVVAMFSTLAEALMRGSMRDLFCGATTLTPEETLEGRIIVVDLPLKEWSEVGRVAAGIWKYSVQKAIERRPDNAHGQARPVFLWADECQCFVSRQDPLFQATARSSRAATVYLTQSIPSLEAALGGGSGTGAGGGSGRAWVDTLLANLGTKVFHASSERETNRYAAELIGRRPVLRRSFGGGASLGFGRGGSLGASAHQGYSEQMDYEVQPREFATLRKGGPAAGFEAEALVYQNGRVWTATGRTWLKAAFPQRRSGRAGPLPAPALTPGSPGPRRGPG